MYPGKRARAFEEVDPPPKVVYAKAPTLSPSLLLTSKYCPPTRSISRLSQPPVPVPIKTFSLTCRTSSTRSYSIQRTRFHHLELSARVMIKLPAIYLTWPARVSPNGPSSTLSVLLVTVIKSTPAVLFIASGLNNLLKNSHQLGETFPAGLAKLDISYGCERIRLYIHWKRRMTRFMRAIWATRASHGR